MMLCDKDNNDNFDANCVRNRRIPNQKPILRILEIIFNPSILFYKNVPIFRWRLTRCMANRNPYASGPVTVR